MLKLNIIKKFSIFLDVSISESYNRYSENGIHMSVRNRVILIKLYLFVQNKQTFYNLSSRTVLFRFDPMICPAVWYSVYLWSVLFRQHSGKNVTNYLTRYKKILFKEIFNAG